ncbi:MAG: Fe2+-dependent dioxygenase [Saprospiraceae bacterium]|nr:Fe2+-dependent dioxygenase [Saprospiraceae bacterium]
MNQIMGSSYLVVQGLLKPTELDFIDRILDAANFEDGAGTASAAAKSVKQNLQLPKQGSAERQQIGAVVLHAIHESPLIHAALMPKMILPPLVSKYEPGMHYGHHVDSPIMSDEGGTIRTDVGMTLFLSHPESYEGGELEVFTQTGPQRFKLRKGDAIIYPTTAIHGVLPVTQGTRLAAVTWMQCAVRDAQQREILFQLKSAQSMVEMRDKQAPESLALLQVYSNLVRMWAEI